MLPYTKYLEKYCYVKRSENAYVLVDSTEPLSALQCNSKTLLTHYRPYLPSNSDYVISDHPQNLEF